MVLVPNKRASKSRYKLGVPNKVAFLLVDLKNSWA